MIGGASCINYLNHDCFDLAVSISNFLLPPFAPGEINFKLAVCGAFKRQWRQIPAYLDYVAQIRLITAKSMIPHIGNGDICSGCNDTAQAHVVTRRRKSIMLGVCGAFIYSSRHFTMSRFLIPPHDNAKYATIRQ